MDGVAREQQLALVLQVLEDELVRHALELQGRLRTVDGWAAEGADELDWRRHLCSIQATS